MKSSFFALTLQLCIASLTHAQMPPRATLRLAPVSISTAQDREHVAITVYHQNFGLVREIRNVAVAAGRSSLEFRDVAAQVQPETVIIKSLNGKMNVLEQNYRFDILSPKKLLEKYVGRRVKVYRWNEKMGREDALDADVLAVNDGQVLKIGNEVTFDYPGRIGFPELPSNLIAKPTLVWLLDSSASKQKMEVTYLTQGMGWEADYVLVINPHDTTGDLTGWVTLKNESGSSYENATLKLVAGDVQRVATQSAPRLARAVAMDLAEKRSEFKEESFFEYHLYTLNRPTTLLENETKQTTLLDAQGIKVKKKFIFAGSPYYFRGRYGQVNTNTKIAVFLEIENKQNNRLGVPLPKGTVRVYKADAAGARQFVGESAIDHTPRDEKLIIKTGEAFDIVGDRTQTDYKALGACSHESTWELSLRNHKDNAVDVEVNEPVSGEWEVLSSSLPAIKTDQHVLKFFAKVDARGKTSVKYRIRVRYC